MDDAIRKEYETSSRTLRAELKKWETSWAKTHDGQKPSRDDIKQNPDIAQKYKSYNKFRDILSGKLPPPSLHTAASPSRKRKSASSTAASHAAQTPSKRLRTTPSAVRTVNLPCDVATPSLNRRLLFSPASAKPPTPTTIGPTPQRDGRVLGLFDLLSGSEDTPSRPRTGALVAAQATTTQPAATPRKTAQPSNPDHASGSTATPARRRGSRTPMSTGKRALLDNFLLFTPLKDRDGNAGASFAARIGVLPAASAAAATDKENGRGAATPKGPQSVSKPLFATPAFLKRWHKPLDPVDELGEAEEVRPLRLPRKPLGRSLSSVVAGLRRLEEEKLDEEMEAMREMEAELSAPAVANKAEKTDRPAGAEEELERATGVGSAQIQAKPVLLGGFDDEALLDSEEEEQLDRGQPMRVFKKKGQKRTTRRVNMRPTKTARPADVREEGTQAEDEEEIVPETQADGAKAVDEEHGLSGLSASEFEEEREREDTQRKSKAKGKGGEEKEGTVKKAVRKVKATAHANFKRLKLRNYGAKGGPGHNSRFRRR